MKKKAGYFDKFTKKKSNAAIKEQFRQEKRKIKKEREEFFEKKRAEIRKAKEQGSKVTGQGTRHKDPGTRIERQGTKNKEQETSSRAQVTPDKKPGTPTRRPASSTQHPASSRQQPASSIKPPASSIQHPASSTKPPAPGQMPLNKFIAHSGVAARREAADIVKQGKVKVNNVVITEPGHKVSAQDDVKVNGKKIFLAKNLVYILLNKPKDYITTTDDPQGRKTVLDLTRRATPERIYPVGRLDRNTSGVLLLTNDGELSQKLTHPSNEIKKVYHVTLDKPLEKKDFERVIKGVVLEDGVASVDVLAYADAKDKSQIGVEIHSGRNRIVRRIFEALGYDVKNLDRVIFAGLTKKNIERGKWRSLTEKEVRDLKHFKKGR
jgi:23S rRNA pseudouridine2605 synthase